MEKYSEAFFDSFNLAAVSAYDTYMKVTEGDFPRGNDDSESKLHINLQDEYKKWLYTPLESLGGRTPPEYLETIDSLSKLTEMFTYGAVACDDNLPEIFLDKLRIFGEAAIDVLLEMAAQNDSGDNEEGFLISLMAVKVLGAWKVERAVEPLIKLLDAESGEYDLMAETVRDTLVSIGDRAINGILGALETGKHSQTAVEYLIMSLADIGKRNRCDKIYLQLKKTFISMEQKIIAANCLGNYGDGRAIPSLRGYLEKNRQQLNKETFYEIVSVIKRLGGSTDDLKFISL